MNIVRKLYFRLLQEWSNSSREHYARLVGVRVGQNCRLYSTNFGSEPYLISLGNYVTITEGVFFLTHDGGVEVFRRETPGADSIRPIIIHDNCFIGVNALILPGVIIGPNCVIGAGSVVTKRIPTNSVAAGVPAKVIGTLDAYRKRIDAELLTHDYSHAEKKNVLLKYFGDTTAAWEHKIEELDRRSN